MISRKYSTYHTTRHPHHTFPSRKFFLSPCWRKYPKFIVYGIQSTIVAPLSNVCVCDRCVSCVSVVCFARDTRQLTVWRHLMFLLWLLRGVRQHSLILQVTTARVWVYVCDQHLSFRILRDETSYMHFQIPPPPFKPNHHHKLLKVQHINKNQNTVLYFKSI